MPRHCRGRGGRYGMVIQYGRSHEYPYDAETQTVIDTVRSLTSKRGHSISLHDYRIETENLLVSGLTPIVTFYLQGDLGINMEFLTRNNPKPWTLRSIALSFVEQSVIFADHGVRTDVKQMGTGLKTLLNKKCGQNEDIDTIKIMGIGREALKMFPKHEPPMLPFQPPDRFDELYQTYKTQRKKMRQLWRNCIRHLEILNMSAEDRGRAPTPVTAMPLLNEAESPVSTGMTPSMVRRTSMQPSQQPERSLRTSTIESCAMRAPQKSPESKAASTEQDSTFPLGWSRSVSLPERSTFPPRPIHNLSRWNTQSPSAISTAVAPTDSEEEFTRKLPSPVDDWLLEEDAKRWRSTTETETKSQLSTGMGPEYDHFFPNYDAPMQLAPTPEHQPSSLGDIFLGVKAENASQVPAPRNPVETSDLWRSARLTAFKPIRSAGLTTEHMQHLYQTSGHLYMPLETEQDFRGMFAEWHPNNRAVENGRL